MGFSADLASLAQTHHSLTALTVDVCESSTQPLHFLTHGHFLEVALPDHSVERTLHDALVDSLQEGWGQATL